MIELNILYFFSAPANLTKKLKFSVHMNSQSYQNFMGMTKILEKSNLRHK